MTYIRGKDAKVFITTESGDYGVTGLDVGAAVASGTPGKISDRTGIGKLGTVITGASSDHIVPGVVGIEYTTGEMRTEHDIFNGKDYTHFIRHNHECSITLTLLSAEKKPFGVLFNSDGRHGVTEISTAAAFVSSLSEIPDDVGYRLYVYHNGRWLIFYHMRMDDDGWRETIVKRDTNIETVKFSGYYWDMDVLEAEIDDPYDIRV